MRELYKVMYLSLETDKMSSQELDDLMVKCREKNAHFNVTGYMIYYKGMILQLLEGKRTSVEYIYNTVKHDKRHSDILELCKSSIEKRIFTNWHMGFKNLDHEQILKIQTVQQLFSGGLSKPELAQFCSHTALFFESFLKLARLNNYTLLRDHMAIL